MKAKKMKIEVSINPKVTRQISKVLSDLGMRRAFPTPQEFISRQKMEKIILSSAKFVSMFKSKKKPKKHY